ncbi:MAG: hypothetical protein ACREQX_16535 [Candidatus Binataceae bacterium]
MAASTARAFSHDNASPTGKRDLDGDGRDEIIATFADQPVTQGSHRHCVSGGGITIWKLTKGIW